MTFWNRVYCLLGLWTYILYQIHAAAFCKYAILDIIGTKSLPYPRLITTCMNQNLLCSSQVIKFPEVIPYNFQTKCFKTLTFEQHSLPSTCIFISFSMGNSAPKYIPADLHLRPFNPFGSTSDQHQFSPNIVCTSSREKCMSI